VTKVSLAPFPLLGISQTVWISLSKILTSGLVSNSFFPTF